MTAGILALLRCPHCGQRLERTAGALMTADGSHTYPVRDGIIDFLPEQGAEAYRNTAGNYDDFLTGTSRLARLYNRLVWGFADDREYADDLVEGLPDDFAGVLLDIPVGTGVFTAEKYARMKSATILAVDYSLAMLQRAREACADLENVTFIHADVTRLPLKDDAVDAILTMNGVHAFPDKPAAFVELARTLRPDGQLRGCFYVRGQRLLTDLVVSRFYERKGWFCAPHLESQTALTLLSRQFDLHGCTPYHSLLQVEGRRRN